MFSVESHLSAALLSRVRDPDDVWATQRAEMPLTTHREQIELPKIEIGTLSTKKARRHWDTGLYSPRRP